MRTHDMLVEKVEYGGGVVETLSVDIKIKREAGKLLWYRNL